MNTTITAHSMEQAEGKLERIRAAREASEQNARNEAHAIPFGQPNIEGRGDIYKHVKQEWRRAAHLADEEERVVARVDMLEKVEKFKENNGKLQDVRVVGRTGWASVGAATSVNNLDYFKDKLARMIADNEAAKAWNKSHKDERKHTFGARITQLKKKIAYLEQMQEQVENTAISAHSQQLIDSGEVTQWRKKPIYYFVKGLRKVALTLDEQGNFQPSKRYPPITEDAQQRVAALIRQ
ncbi:hypothetical protein [Bifidobacterium crudilactis]|uniref:hypothetical protein n=2 Tax=Bifidobacterium crudilactis TaxID=327277 RepID=UPI002647ADA0|nr:hypothetical protein [Bifidobacterium crudilactis]MDN6805425.1 hypothetical protein [Bifidobacterium crudilactis]